MSFIDKDDYNGAWDVIDPYFITLRREQWLKEIKQMFVDSYGNQIEALKNDVEGYYSAIRSLNDQISQQYKCIENAEIKIRGMLASNSTEKKKRAHRGGRRHKRSDGTNNQEPKQQS
jgi:hypothetical protein